jgi:hypothetical protein
MTNPIQGLRARARRYRQAHDSPELASLRGLVRSLTDGPAPDVLYFGDSLTLFRAPYDADPTLLPEMIFAQLPGTTANLAIRGASYHPGMFRAYLSRMAALAARPRVIIVPLSIRVASAPWAYHPGYAYTDEIERIRSIDPSTPWRKIRGAAIPLDETRFEALDARVHEIAFGKTRTIGEFRLLLSGVARTATQRDVRVRNLVAFHHGERLDPSAGPIDQLRFFAAELTDLGVPVVAYQTPINHEYGERLFGPEFTHHVVRNQDVMLQAFREGDGGRAKVLETGLSLANDQFIDPADGTEHINQHGRKRFADAIAAATTAILTNPAPQPAPAPDRPEAEPGADRR